MDRRALITGITGQDGSYLAELLLEKGYRVCGIMRRQSVAENQDSRIAHIAQMLDLEYGDLLDYCSLDRLVSKYKPDEIYNLAGMSHVRVSFDIPDFTTQVNSIGPMNLLEIARRHVPGARFYQACSSEMFGVAVDDDHRQRETTHMHPTSPYGCSKLFAYAIVRHYRRAYKMFASNGILFNHESPRRGSNFVTAKVVKTAVQIKLGLADHLSLGNLDSYRDWGHSKDYVRAMHLILNHDAPDDFVIATGDTHTVRDLCQYVFTKLGLDPDVCVRQDSQFMRAEELPFLCGDSSKARRVLGWKPEYTFSTLLDEMLEHWLQVLTPASKD